MFEVNLLMVGTTMVAVSYLERPSVLIEWAPRVRGIGTLITMIAGRSKVLSL